MATFVIVHGGWGGGWEWTPVARELQTRGHDVFTPTLTGLGERSHLAADVPLADHVDDVVATLEFERLDDVILCGHSYGGMVVTGVASEVPERLRMLCYLDAFVPQDGQSMRDLVPPDVAEAFLLAADERGDGRIPYPPDLEPPAGLIPEEARRAYVSRMRPHPVASFTGPVRLSGGSNALPRAFVRCTGTREVEPEGSVASFAARARVEGWRYLEIAAPHDVQLFAPERTAALLHDLAAPSR